MSIEVMPLKRQHGLLIFTALAILYLSGNLLSGRVIGGFFGNYIIPILSWSLLGLTLYRLVPQGKPLTRRRHREMLIWAAVISALALIAAVYAVGLLEGYGKSPYDQSFTGILINIFYLGSMLLGMEVARARLINYLFRKKPLKGVILATIIFTLFAFALGRLFSFETTLDGARFAGNTFLPALAENALASYLALLGGPLPAITYRGLLVAYQWFMPILPDLNWVTWALIGTFVPAFCLAMVYQLYRSEVLRIRSREQESPVGWLITSVFSVVMIWFAVGVFSIFPNVIISGSMRPHIDVGDIVIVKSVEAELVEVGDIIQFIELEQQIRINHRVIEIREDDRGQPLFVTKGDANNSIDSDPVIVEQLKGRVIQVIPKIGWITIAMRNPG
jgi:signal peptidase